MTPDKRRKVKAMLDNPASTENEKAICRRILKDHPETEGQEKRRQESGDFWRQFLNEPHQQFRQQAQWADRDNRPYIQFSSVFEGVAGLGQQHAAQRQQAAAQAQQDALRRDAERRQQAVSRQTVWERLRETIYQSKEERDRVITLQREAIRNNAQQRLVDLLKKKK